MNMSTIAMYFLALGLTLSCCPITVTASDGTAGGELSASELHGIISGLRQKQEALTTQIAAVISQNELLQQKIDSIQNSNREKVSLTSLNERLSNIEEENTQLKNDISQYCVPDVRNAFVAFLATPSTDTYYYPNEVLGFDNVTLNVGNHYAQDTSSFVCPYTGYYLFSVSVSNVQYGAEHMRRIDGELWIDDVMTQKAIAGHAIPAPADNWYTHQGSITGIYQCSSGQNVTVRATVSEEFSPAGLYSGPHSSFSGFLVSLIN